MLRNLLIDSCIGEYVILDSAIKEIKMVNNKKKKFIHDNWDLSTIIIIKNTDTINDLEKKLMNSDLAPHRIFFNINIIKIKNTIFSYFNLPIDIKKITFILKLEQVL